MMAKLTGSEIARQRELGRIIIEPFDLDHLQPNGYDLTLGTTLLIYEDRCLDMKKEPKTLRRDIGPEGRWLTAGQLYLGVTNECAGSDFYVPSIEGRSSVARLGLQMHIAAGLGDLHFKGRWTLEIVATQPTKVYAGVRVAQVFFETVEGEIKTRYAGKYSKDVGAVPTASRLYRDFEK